MALAFDAASSSSTAGATSLTFPHTCTGSNLVLVVGVTLNGVATDVITGITYNGVALTKGISKGAPTGTENNWAELWHLKAPATGTHDIVISASSSVAMVGLGVSYTGADQVTQPDATSSNTAEGVTSLATAVTTVKDNSWAIIVCTVDGGVLSASTNVTQRQAVGAPRDAIGDSNGAITPAGSYTQTWTRSTSGRMVTAQISIMPVQPVTTGGAFLFNFI